MWTVKEIDNILSWAYELSDKIIDKSKDFKDLDKNGKLKRISLLVGLFFDLDWLRFFVNATQKLYSLQTKEEKILFLKLWKDHFPEHKDNETLQKIVDEKLFQLSKEEGYVHSRLLMIQYALSLLMKSYDVFSPFFQSLCMTAMILDDATDIEQDFKHQEKTIFTMMPPEKARKEALMYLINCYNSISEDYPQTIEFTTLDIVGKTFMAEQGLQEIPPVTLFWLLAVHKVNHIEKCTKMPFRLSEFLNSI